MESRVGVKGRKWQVADDSVFLEKNKKMKLRLIIVGISAGIAVLTSCGKEAELLMAPVPMEQKKEVKIFIEVEQMPMFPGGQKALTEYLAKNVQYPKEMEETCAQGRVIVSFFVEKDGRITEAKVVRSLCSALDEEALRVVNAMPKWCPGKQNGACIRVKYTLPVTFRLQ